MQLCTKLEWLRRRGAIGAYILAGWVIQLPGQQAMRITDPYGGTGRPVAPPGKYFRIIKKNRRWILVTPTGRAFWLLGVYNVQPPEAIPAAGLARTHWRGGKRGWGVKTVQQLCGWGFNTLGEYSSLYTWPIPWPYGGHWRNPQRMAFIGIIRPARYSLLNRHGWAPGAVKDLLAGVKLGYYRGWRGRGLPDVFDPNFSRYARAEARHLPAKERDSRWLIGIATDDVDDLVGFGPGPRIPARRCSINPGWMVLVTDYQQKFNARLHQHYADPVVYSKLALERQLRRHYGTIARLNAAWGAHYFRFGDAGGWGRGSGWLDEDGRHSWISRDPCHLTGAPSAEKRDLNYFVERFARHYFRVTAEAIHQAAPGHLIWGPAALNGWGGLSRAGILRAAAQYVDVIQAGAAAPRVFRLTEKRTQGKPLALWLGLAANRDSELKRFPRGAAGIAQFPTQAARGKAYARKVLGGYGMRTPGGMAPIIGVTYWDYADSWAEKMNWGLVGLDGRPYQGRPDGKLRLPQSDVASGKTKYFRSDDFIRYVVQANHAVIQNLRNWARRLTRSGPGERNSARQK